MAIHSFFHPYELFFHPYELFVKNGIFVKYLYLIK